MADEVKLYVDGRSPYVCRVEIALKLKGVEYEIIEEDLNNKSADLLKYNPVYKQIPVLVLKGNPISDSLVIVEYIDDVWELGYPILPQDPYDKAAARFWAKFVDDTCLPAMYQVIRTKGDELVVAEANSKLQMLENKLINNGTKFFGGDNINMVDIAAVFIAYWPDIIEEAGGMKTISKEKFPKLVEWAHNFINCQVVKEILPPRVHLLAFFKKRYAT